MGDIKTPETLSEYDFWELEAYWQKVRREGRRYAWENYSPAFEFADYEPVPYEVAQDLLDRHRADFIARWDADGDAACDAHNAHVDESNRRASERRAAAEAVSR
jgi:hypothetical protein